MSLPRPSPEETGDPGRFYLPDFCAAPAVLAVVLIGSLLGVVLALARPNVGHAFWTDLARTSAFLLWTGLLCAAVLCRTRPHLAQMTLARASGVTLATIVGTVALVAEAAYWFGRLWEDRVGVRTALFPTDHWSFLLPKLGIALIVGALALRYFYVASQWRRSIELEALARIRALQARIRPHFLFNSMNTIAALTRSDPVRAEEAIEDLADLFRASLSDARTQIPLHEEFEIARIYQRMEQLRLGDRLRVDWDIAMLPAQAVVPSLLVQPLLENAIGHGIEALPDGGTVTVRGSLDARDIVIEVSNPTLPPPLRRASRPSNRLALDNIRQRLDLAFPGRSEVTVEDRGDVYVVRLRFPRTVDAQAKSEAEPSGTALLP